MASLDVSLGSGLFIGFVTMLVRIKFGMAPAGDSFFTVLLVRMTAVATTATTSTTKLIITQVIIGAYEDAGTAAAASSPCKN